jgi:hypothetical protein
MVASTTIRYAKSSLANALLVTISIFATYAVAELVFFRLALPYMSLNLLPHIPDRATFFLQSSKTEYVPRNYIALLGDSYAQGMGDWLLETGGDQAKPHHSADVLNQVLGTDVVTLGRGASGSAEALVLRFSRVFGDSHCYLFPRIEDPKQILIYFSEAMTSIISCWTIKFTRTDRISAFRLIDSWRLSTGSYPAGDAMDTSATPFSGWPDT